MLNQLAPLFLHTHIRLDANPLATKLNKNPLITTCAWSHRTPVIIGWSLEVNSTVWSPASVRVKLLRRCISILRQRKQLYPSDTCIHQSIVEGATIKTCCILQNIVKIRVDFVRRMSKYILEPSSASLDCQISAPKGLLQRTYLIYSKISVTLTITWVTLVPDGLVCVFHKLLISRDFHRIFQIFPGIGVKNKNIQ